MRRRRSRSGRGEEIAERRGNGGTRLVHDAVLDHAVVVPPIAERRGNLVGGLRSGHAGGRGKGEGERDPGLFNEL